MTQNCTDIIKKNCHTQSQVQWQALFKDHVQHKYEKSALGSTDIHRCISEGWGQQCGLWVLASIAECKSALQFLLRSLVWELQALYMALQYVEGIFPKKTYVICTDSLSSLQAIGKNTIEHNIGKQIIEILLPMKSHIQLMWVPSHQGISGNEAADQLAGNATTLNNYTTVPHSADDIISEGRRSILARWQLEWQQQSWQLRKYRPTLGTYKNSHQKSRQWETALARLRLGVCVFTHQHFYSGNARTQCIPCNVPVTIQHLLIDCPAHEEERKIIREFFLRKTVFNLPNILGIDAPITEIMEYIFKIGYIGKI